MEVKQEVPLVLAGEKRMALRTNSCALEQERDALGGRLGLIGAPRSRGGSPDPQPRDPQHWSELEQEPRVRPGLVLSHVSQAAQDISTRVCIETVLS